MDRTTLAPIASHMMNTAVSNLVHDGYAAFATMLIGKDKTITTVMVESTSSSNKEAFGNSLETFYVCSVLTWMRSSSSPRRGLSWMRMSMAWL
eukprot:6460468-Prymnesium_polylepis.2